jgi:tetratricopeptide (TPR) repeat protein
VRRAFLLLLLAAQALLVVSCGTGTAHFDVLRGNYYYSRGMYQQAMIAYLAAREQPGNAAWVSFNLAGVYQALGETGAALDSLKEAEKSDDKELQFNVSFNRGLFFHESGRYKEAFGEFRHALELNPASLEAKINLEHTLKRLSLSAQSSVKRPAPRANSRREDTERILEYVRKKEGNRWYAPERMKEEDTARDW